MELIWKPVSANNLTGLDLTGNSTIMALPYSDVLKFWSDLAKICFKNESFTQSCKVINGYTEPGSCNQENDCECGEHDNGYLHNIYNMFGGHSQNKKHGKENIILHYLSGQLSRLFNWCQIWLCSKTVICIWYYKKMYLFIWDQTVFQLTTSSSDKMCWDM